MFRVYYLAIASIWISSDKNEMLLFSIVAALTILISNRSSTYGMISEDYIHFAVEEWYQKKGTKERQIMCLLLNL